MSPSVPVDDNVSDASNLTLILRLVINRRGELMHGEIVDVDLRSLGRFAAWTQMVRILRTWLESQSTDESADRPSGPDDDM